jgi:cysteine-rich repeat protein
MALIEPAALVLRGDLEPAPAHILFDGGKMKTPLRLGILAALCLGPALLRATETINFNDLDPGAIVGTINLPGMGTVVIKGIRPGLPDNPSTNFAITFPSHAPPGLDFDLGSPNQTCGGPGVSNDVPGNPDSGEVGGAHPNCPPPSGPLDPADPNVPLNNVLIVADNLTDADMDGLVDVPNDHAGDNNLIFKFMDKAVRFTSIALLDIQAPLAESAKVFLYEDVDCTNLIAEIDLDETGDNGLIIFKFEPFDPSRCMIVDVNGSGAIDNIVVNACGDGVVDPGEACDDGNSNNFDACRNDCTPSDCGDGVVDDGEECDAGIENSDAPCAPCRSDCTQPECGDGVADVGCGPETCDGDDLAETACESCRETCTCCGDGVVQESAGEECDDGNNSDNDDCRSDCTEPACGDGTVDPGEDCDDGNEDDDDGCRNNCMEPACGDGALDPNESCDGMALGDNACESCRADCSCCGDGVTDVSAGEECDDGNGVDDDDCSNSCTAPDVLECRVTGGANGGDSRGRRANAYHGAGQAGAPGPDFGEWTHHQKSGPDGKFIFHAGTASSPDETFIEVVTCSDPGFCFPARPAPAKQIDFQGVGQFKNMSNPSPALSSVSVQETLHWFEVHIEDLGEPGGPQGGNDAELCPPEGSAGALAHCGCPDFYRIDIYAGFEPGEAPDKTNVIYSVFGYIDSGNYQIHPALR